ncbi:unnamed protein product [Closterium sp. NIES-53]
MAFRRVLSRVASSVRQAASKPGGVLKGVEDAAPHRLSSTLPQRVPELVDLRETMEEVVPEQRARLAEIKAKYGDMVLGDVTVNMAVGGMRGIKGLLWETSQLDPLKGIKFRGLSIPECQAQLPSALDGGQPLPEALLWLLLTGEVPTEEQAVSLAVELQDRARLPDAACQVIWSLPPSLHPMTQLSIAVLALQRTSKFAAAYHRGTHKRDLWRHALDDSLDLIAALPEIAARIYNRSCKEGGARPGVRAAREDLDYAGNLAHMMGFDDERMDELLRLYLTIHADHEGGNVSAHATHLVGSALSDPFLALSAGLNGLAGPLHGLANQEVLGWLHALRAELGERPSKEQLGEHVRRGLAAGRVVPGYGHAVLRVTDPRYSCQREFARQHMAHDPMVQLVSDLYEVVPPILQETGKVQNPWPNVDAHSGVLLQHLGLTHANFYTVLFGVSRAMGVLSQCYSTASTLMLFRHKCHCFVTLFLALSDDLSPSPSASPNAAATAAPAATTASHSQQH